MISCCELQMLKSYGLRQFHDFLLQHFVNET